jgi:hypothetical protein
MDPLATSDDEDRSAGNDDARSRARRGVARRGGTQLEKSPTKPAMLQRLTGDRPGDRPARAVTRRVTGDATCAR